MTPLGNEQDIDLLDRYIQGHCNEKESIEVRDRLSKDVSFKDIYNLLISMSEGTRVDNLSEKWSQLRDIESSLDQSQIEPEKTDTNIDSTVSTIKSADKKVKRFPYIRLAVAATLAFMIAMTANKIMNKKDEVNMPVAELEPYIRHETIRSSEKKQLLSDDQQIAYNNYVLRDFKDAKPLLSDLWDNDRDTLALYYLGISHWFSGDETKAKEILNLPFYNTYEKPY